MGAIILTNVCLLFRYTGEIGTPTNSLFFVMGVTLTKKIVFVTRVLHRLRDQFVARAFVTPWKQCLSSKRAITGRRNLLLRGVTPIKPFFFVTQAIHTDTVSASYKLQASSSDHAENRENEKRA